MQEDFETMMIKKDWLTIGEVADMMEVPIHTLRYWESEFGEFFNPLRTTGRQRRYDEEAVHRIIEIKTLLKEEKYSIAGARQVLAKRDDDGFKVNGVGPPLSAAAAS